MKPSKILLLAVTGALCLGGIVSTPSHAATSKPSAPTVAKIVSKNKGSKSSLTVTLTFPENTGGAPIKGIKISAGSKSCTASGAKKSCTITGLKKGVKYKVSGQVKNSKGYSKASGKVSFKAGVKSWEKKLQLTKVLAQTGVKFSNFQALGKVTPRLNTLNIRSIVRISSASDSVVFDTSGAVGVATVSSQDAGATSGLVAVTATGTIRDALLSGDAMISNVLTTASGDYYVLFSSATALTSGTVPCLLARVNYTTGAPTCIDNELNQIQWDENDMRHGAAIQFDDNGNIFYIGTLTNGKTALRKYSNGTVTNLIADNIYLNDFLVLSNGSVIVSGTTQSTGARWTRLISATGSIKNLMADQDTSFIHKFADGRIYIGGNNNISGWNIRRMNSASNAVESMFWYSDNWPSNAKYTAQDYCDGDKAVRFSRGFCSTGGALVQRIFNVLGKKTFGIVGTSGDYDLVQYYPTLKAATTSVDRITLSQTVISNVLLAGTTASGTNTLTIYDTGNDIETVLMDASNEIEIYNMNYVASTNVIMFDGLRFADNQYVIGQVDLN